MMVNLIPPKDWSPFYNNKPYGYNRKPRTPRGWNPEMKQVPSCGQCIAYHGETPCETKTSCIHKNNTKEDIK